MTDIEKEMLKEINNNSYEVAASACYEIHKREMDKRKQELAKESSVKKFRFYRRDNMEGFAAYLSPSIIKDEHGIILLDVEASLSICHEHDLSFKEILIENMMHEFGHALEEFYGLEFSEDRIEKIIAGYVEKFKKFKGE